MLKEWPAARLELAGDGDRREELEQLAGDLGIARAVRFLGMVSDVYAVMQHWDIFAYATTDREGLGNALAEAMMLGLPCIVTDGGPMREVGATAARFVPPADDAAMAEEIVAAAGNRTLRQSLSCAAQTRAQTGFSPSVFSERHLSLL